ncbi:MAG: biotin transporter BioY, partial [Coriobacteriia bacterium]|nr:biotin transporter BioY [Coriobacteriia bacterium]
TRDLTLVALFVAIIAVLAQLTVPLPYVPLTMQTFAVAFAGLVLGVRRGTLAVCLYLLLGAVGAPVFAGFQGGFHALIGPTGGYLLSFPLFAAIVGYGADRFARSEQTNKARYLWLIAGLMVGSLLNLLLGTLQLALVTQMGLQAAFFAGMFPFIVPELIKLTLVVSIAPKIRQVVANAAAPQGTL